MEFRILGPLVIGDPEPLALGPPKQRALLATLLLGYGQVQSVERLVEALWDDHPPATARGLVSLYVHRLRRVLGRRLVAQEPALLTIPPGYLLRIEPHQLDLFVFEELVERARQAADEGDWAAAASDLRAALVLWRGPALSDVDSHLIREVEVPRLEERRLDALEQRIEAELALGQHGRLVSELRSLVAEHPFRERFCAQFMLALHRSGRRAEALQTYDRIQRTLSSELGIEPGAGLQQLMAAVLADDPALRLAAVETASPVAIRPSQLPPDVADFTGRERELAQLCDLVTASQGAGLASPVVVVTGPAGVGKTALAVRCARLLRDRFPDGELHVDLRRAGPEELDPADILFEFLTALGANPDVIPDGLAERERRYRSHVAGRRLLVVLDNAGRESQVRPLLSGEPRSATIVTSRQHLPGLEAARVLKLDMLDVPQAIELLGMVAGAERVAEDSDAAEAIVRLCGRLPLAVRIAGAKLALRAQWPLRRMVERLADEQRTLDELSIGDLQVRGSFAISYQAQNVEAQRAFRLLALSVGPDVPLWAAAVLLDTDHTATERVLDCLVDAQLLALAGRDRFGQARYRHHDLLRLFAHERLAREEPELERRTAQERLLKAYVAAVEAAGSTMRGSVQIVFRPAETGRRPLGAPLAALLDRDAVGWLRDERPGVLAAVALADQLRLDRTAWELARALAPLFEHDALWQDWERTCRLGLAAAERSGDLLGQALMCDGLGVLHHNQARWPEAVHYLERSMRLFELADQELGVADALRKLGMVHGDAGRFDEAKACLERCLPTLGRHRHRFGVAYVLHGLGLTERDRRAFDTGIARLIEHLAAADGVDQE